MKKILSIVFVIILFAHIGSGALAAAPTPTDDISEQINSLKERIASRVAELKLVEKRGVIGTVTDVSETQLTLNDTQDNTVFIDVDELTKFTSPNSNGSFGISDISKGSTVGILGLYNKESRRILARFVDVLTLMHTYSGAITDKDTKNFSFSIMTNENKHMSVDVENTTKTYVYTKEDNLIKSGFSKLQIGERIFISGFIDSKNQNNIIASRIIRFPELPVNPDISISPTQSVEISPTKSLTHSTGLPKPTQ